MSGVQSLFWKKNNNLPTIRHTCDFFLSFRWHATIQHVKQYKQISECSFNVSLDGSLCEEAKSTDDLSVIMNVYAECLTKQKNGKLKCYQTEITIHESISDFIFSYLFTDAFILSRSENELNEIYSILMENLYYITAAISEMELNLKTSSSTTVRNDIDITTL